jgi:nicotinamide-nucleotide amidase
MGPILDHVVTEYLAPKAGGTRLFRRVLKITGRTESDVDATAQPVYTRWLTRTVPISTTILASLGQIELHLTAASSAEDEARVGLDEAVRELQAALGTSVYSSDGSALEDVVGHLLRGRGLTVAAAESCTGGLLTSRLTDVPGSSAYVERAAVCYSNRSKVELLGVSESVLDAHGAVSEPVALAMAAGIRAAAGADVGIGVTGIAGPGGGTPEKPVGTVAIAVVTPWEEKVLVFWFPGSRDQVKGQATQAALNMVRLLLQKAQRGVAKRP